MITIKIQCLCGQKYAFEVDPADALLAEAVQCPVCGADGTKVARGQIARFFPSTASRKLCLSANQPSEIALPALPPPVPRALPQRPRNTERRAARRWLVIRTLGVTRSMIALEQSLNRTCLPSESLKRLSLILHRMEEFDARGEGFNRALAAERANGLALLADPDKLLQALNIPGGTSTKAAQAQLAHRLEKQPTLELEAQFFKQAVRRILVARDREFPERLQSDLVARDELAEARSRKLTALEAVLPPFAGRATQEGECLAQLRLGVTAVALEQYRRAHDNRYPDMLSALSPEYLSATPVDPFQGRILAYQKEGLGYTLRSPEAKAGLGRHSQIRPRGLLIEVFAPPIPRP